MIKSSDDNTQSPADRAGSRAVKCWHRDPDTRELRLETADNGTFLFPHQQRMFAHLIRSGDEDILTLGFPTHEVTIRGTRLSLILEALQDGEVKWIKALPARHVPLAPEGSAVVTDIKVSLSGEDEPE